MHKKGYIAISSILVIGVVVLSIGISVALLTVNELQSSLASSKGSDALMLIEGCTEDALLRINHTGTVSATVTNPIGSCTLTITSQVGNNWVFRVAGQKDGYTREVEVSASRSSQLKVTKWIEL